jgi:hypothetical protein
MELVRASRSPKALVRILPLFAINPGSIPVNRDSGGPHITGGNI